MVTSPCCTMTPLHCCVTQGDPQIMWQRKEIIFFKKIIFDHLGHWDPETEEYTFWVQAQSRLHFSLPEPLLCSPCPTLPWQLCCCSQRLPKHIWPEVQTSWAKAQLYHGARCPLTFQVLTAETCPGCIYLQVCSLKVHISWFQMWVRSWSDVLIESQIWSGVSEVKMSHPSMVLIGLLTALSGVRASGQISQEAHCASQRFRKSSVLGTRMIAQW